MQASLSESLGILMIVAAVLVMLAQKIKMPALVVYMLTGLILGPFTGLLTPNHILDLISESGIILLLFLVGLELNIEKVKDVGVTAMVAGSLQVFITSGLGFLIAFFFGFTAFESFYIAAGLTFSSTVVVVKLLDQKGHLSKLYGRIAIGIFLIQDIVVVILLTVMTALAQVQNPDINAITLSIGKVFLSLGIIVVGIFIASRYLIPRPFLWAARSADTLFIWSLTWCFGVVLLAEELHLSAEVGAFLAGIALAQHDFSEDLRRRVHPVMTFFIIVFFILLSVRMDFSRISSQLPIAIVLTTFVLVGKSIIIYLILSKMKFTSITAIKSAITVAQISEFSFIFIANGVKGDLVGNHIMSLISLVGILSISVSAYLIMYTDALVMFLLRFNIIKISKNESIGKKEMAQKVIVIGMNSLGREVVARVRGKGFEVLAIDTDTEKLKGLDCATMLGNVEYKTTLEEAGFHNALLVVSALQIEDTNNLLASHCKKEGIPFAVHAFDPAMKDGLVAIGADHIISPKESVILAYKRWLLEEAKF